jgi:hypothetical protein
VVISAIVGIAGHLWRRDAVYALSGFEQAGNTPFMLALFALRCVVSVGYIYLCRAKHIRFSGLGSEAAPVAVEKLSNETVQTNLAKLEKLDQLEQVLFKRDSTVVTIEPERETPPALPVTTGNKQAVTQEASELAALFPSVPGVSTDEVKSVVDAYLSGIAKRDICSHLRWSNRRYTSVVKPVLDQLQKG